MTARHTPRASGGEPRSAPRAEHTASRDAGAPSGEAGDTSDRRDDAPTSGAADVAPEHDDAGAAPAHAGDARRAPLAADGTQLEFSDHRLFHELLGHHDEHLKTIERALSVRIGVSGKAVSISGDEPSRELAASVLTQLYGVLERGLPVYASDVDYAVRIVSGDRTANVRDIFLDTIYIAAHRRVITPKSVAQKAYIDAIRKHDIVFAIGPAGTGKTYLAMAMGIADLMKQGFTRIILTRPAVEAGEKLGFLPGDLAEKVNPYLRPLYDALHDMVDFDRARKMLERGTIEVAPLAFMRGRAQPYFSRVLTPEGWRPIGSLRPGDSVIGSDGRATAVLGVFPQGVKEVFRVVAQDGGSTLACGEHLWSVSTPADRRRGKPPRQLETREMIGRLRCAHQHRFELPLLSRPVEFDARDVPMDPYALGLLLGDGCITGKTTPTFTTADAELVLMLERELGDVELVRKTGTDYTLRHVGGGRGGLRIPNPVTVTLRGLELSGTRSHTKFVPDMYLYNAPWIRLALLQGILDTDGGPVLQDRRSCRIQYTTTSPRLRDDVVFLVRSLGGVAYCRTRPAAGRRPGRARGRDVEHRHDAYTIEIRLPPGMTPFRLARKRDAYVEAGGGGRPMRYVDAIEPVGEQDCVCIRVAAQDSLYVTDDFLLTHNTLNDSFVILDEAQNTTPEQMKMFLTRLGYGSKAVITGDVTQIDLPAGKLSGLKEAQHILRDIPGIEFVRFSERDVVRHRLVQDIIAAYERAESGGERSRS
ncbi:MAG: phosphate starvation-inducible protein PhoH [Deltaproteobacteria bacterium]|nr:MAG: phosphate starvation-inducible protein PhoH [Deltaproteobacteria bacterium]